MPTTQGLVAALSVERATAERAPLRPAPAPIVEQAPTGGVLAHLDQRLPATVPVGSPTGVSLTTARMDRGRVAMTDACREFGWASGTRVEVTASGGALSVVGIAEDGDASGQRLDRDGRVLIGQTLRRLLNLTTADRVLVATCHHPAPSVRIVPMDVAARVLMTAGVLPGLTEGETR